MGVIDDGVEGKSSAMFAALEVICSGGLLVHKCYRWNYVTMFIRDGGSVEMEMQPKLPPAGGGRS